MPRRDLALRLTLAALLLLAVAPDSEAAPEIAWEVRLLTAPWAGGEPDRVELLLDAGSDALEREISFKQGLFLAKSKHLFRFSFFGDLGCNLGIHPFQLNIHFYDFFIDDLP